MCDFPGFCLVNFEVNNNSQNSGKLGRERSVGVPVAQGEGRDGRADSSRVEQEGGSDSLAPAATGQCVKECKTVKYIGVCTASQLAPPSPSFLHPFHVINIHYKIN